MLRKLPYAAFFGLSLTPSVLAQSSSNPTTPSISWFPCPQNASFPFDCGTLTVPLDYTNIESGGTLNLSLVRANATREPFMGSILMNPGGPGLIGRNLFLDGGGDAYLNFTGGHYNVIAFDPRGTGETIPFACYNATESLLQYVASPRSSNESDVATGRIWGLHDGAAAKCYQRQNQTGSLIGTAFVARDMMRIVDALNEDGLLRFLGYSYGTALGATVAAMFPDRIDKMVLDGVLNMHQYYAGIDVQQMEASDAAFQSFLDGCVAAIPGACALAGNGTSAAQLRYNIDRLLESVRSQPIALGPELTDVVQYGILKVLILQGLRAPSSSWPVLANTLHSIMNRNLTGYLENSYILLGLLDQGTVFPNYGTEAIFGIRCSDNFFRTNNFTTVDSVVNQFENTSHYIGDVLAEGQPLRCAQWQMNAKERYSGNFQVRTRNPILFVGNPLDPLTPLVSARNVSADFEGSAVLQHNGGGHCSLSQPSACSINTIRNYFLNGTLPSAGTQCEPNAPGFPTVNSTQGSARSRVMRRTIHTNEGEELLAAAEKLSRRLFTPQHFLN